MTIGVILAGGLGRRIGGGKAVVELAGKPLITYPLAAMAAVLDEVTIIAKPDTELPSLSGCALWIEPDEAHHPLIGLRRALALARGRPVFVCAADLPFVTPALVERIVRAVPGGAPAVLAAHRGEMQPLLGCYQPAAAELLQTVAVADQPMRKLVGAIGPRLLEVRDPELLFNVNSREDLLAAESLARGRLTRR